MQARVRLQGLTVESVGPLPQVLVGLTASALVDLSAVLAPCPAEWQGVGYWPVAEIQPDYDPDTHRLDHAAPALTVDPAEQRVLSAPAVVPLTDEELSQRLDEAKAAAIAAIKAEAGRRILAAYPYYAQHNATARAIEMLEVALTRPWTEAEAAEAEALRAMRAWIKSVRDTSDVAEAAVLACVTPAEIAALPAPVWP